MIAWFRHFLGWLRSVFCAREDLILENLALPQQLLAFHAKRPRRRLIAADKLFWVVLRRLWAGRKEPLILVTPRTVVTRIVPDSGCIGNGSQESGRGEDASL
jgi:hypothetical protein